MSGIEKGIADARRGAVTRYPAGHFTQRADIERVRVVAKVLEDWNVLAALNGSPTWEAHTRVRIAESILEALDKAEDEADPPMSAL